MNYKSLNWNNAHSWFDRNIFRSAHYLVKFYVWSLMQHASRTCVHNWHARARLCIPYQLCGQYPISIRPILWNGLVHDSSISTWSIIIVLDKGAPDTLYLPTLVCQTSMDVTSCVGSPVLIKAEHECTRGWPRSVPAGISNSKCYTWICVGFSHHVTRSRESKTHGFSSTCGSTGTWKYLQVLSILNRNKVVNCQHKYMWNKILLRHCVTLWQNQIWLNRLCASPLIRSLPLTPTPIPHQKHCNFCKLLF